MPRVNLGKPEWQKAKEAELRERYGGAMTAAAVGRELGIRKADHYMKWLEPLKRNTVTKRYDTAEVARKMYEERA